MKLFESYVLTAEKVAQVFAVHKKPLRVIVFKHWVIVCESKKSPE